MNFAVPVDHRMKNKESEKKEKYLDFARELRKLWNMRRVMIPVVIGMLETVHKGLEIGLEVLEIGGQAEPIQTTVL